MPLKDKVAQDLARSKEHVRQAEQRIAKQRQRIADLEADGHSTKAAKHFLEAMEQLLKPMKDHRDFEAAELARIKRRDHQKRSRPKA